MSASRYNAQVKADQARIHWKAAQTGLIGCATSATRRVAQAMPRCQRSWAEAGDFTAESNKNRLVGTSAPATGTPETGGWSTRELRTIIRGLEGIKLVAADIVEVAPAYDTNAELTTMAAADTLYEVMSLMVKDGPLSVKSNSDGAHDDI